MVVCHCEVVNDHAIRATIAAGACDLEGVASGCGAGERCGGCVPGIEELLADAALAMSSPASLTAQQVSRRISHRAGVELRA
jgi:bacterioferritin-associated ferredoxin